MSIPLSRVKSLCTQTELALVQASRAPQLNRLSLPEARELATRARRMFDKAQGLGRQQGRQQAKRGVGQPGTATAIKEQIFRDALDALERQVQTLQESGATAAAAPAAKKKVKSQRTAQHRASRATVRKGLSELKEELAESAAARRPQPAAKSAAAPAAPASVAAETSAAAPARRPGKQPAAGKSSSKRGLGAPAGGRAADARKQLKANTAAKKTRISMSGLTTRVRGHVSARGKRSQARRDKR